MFIKTSIIFAIILLLEMKDNSSLNSGNLNLLTTEMKTNDQFNSGSVYSKIFSSDKIKNTKKNRIENIKLTFNSSNIRFFNFLISTIIISILL